MQQWTSIFHAQRVVGGACGRREGLGGVRMSMFWPGSLNPHSNIIWFGCFNGSTAQAQRLPRPPSHPPSPARPASCECRQAGWRVF